MVLSGVRPARTLVLNAADYGVAQARTGDRHRPAGRDGRGGPPRRPWASDPAGGPAPGDPVSTQVDLPATTERVNAETVPGPFKPRDSHLTRNPTELTSLRYDSIPPGGNRWDLPDHLLPACWRRTRPETGDVMGRLEWAKPSFTIRTEFFKPEKGRSLHPDEDRPITHYEALLASRTSPTTSSGPAPSRHRPANRQCRTTATRPGGGRAPARLPDLTRVPVRSDGATASDRARLCTATSGPQHHRRGQPPHT